MEQHENYCILDLHLADQGLARLNASMEEMAVLSTIDGRLSIQLPFEGLRITVCAHITKETGCACVALRSGGADVMLIASNPRSTQDDIAASLVRDYGVRVFGYSQQTEEEWDSYKRRAIDFQPDLLLDEASELLSFLYEVSPETPAHFIGSTEQTTGGVFKLKLMDEAGILKHPAIAINSSKIKHLFDNFYGVGQSSVTAMIQATGGLLAGKTVVVIGYGNVGAGIALRQKGMGANVIICEIDPIKALDAYLHGYRVMPLKEAAAYGEIFMTATGSKDVIPLSVIKQLKSGAYLVNCGSGQVEIDVAGLQGFAVDMERLNPFVDKYTLENGHFVNLVADGRVGNIVVSGGNPAEIMDLTFSQIIMAAEYLVQRRGRMKNRMYVMPETVDQKIAKIKLNELMVDIDIPTAIQKKYDNTWHKN